MALNYSAFNKKETQSQTSVAERFGLKPTSIRRPSATSVSLPYDVAGYNLGEESIKVPFRDEVLPPIIPTSELAPILIRGANELIKWFAELPEEVINTAVDTFNVITKGKTKERPIAKPFVKTPFDRAEQGYKAAVDAGYSEKQAAGIGTMVGVGNFLVDMGIAGQLANQFAKRAVQQLPRELLIKIQTTEIPALEIRAALTGSTEATSRAKTFVSSLTVEERKALFSVVQEAEKTGVGVKVMTETEPTLLGKYGGVRPLNTQAFQRNVPELQLPGYRRELGQTPAFGLSTERVERVGGEAIEPLRIPKELEPLAQEARKFKSAEEFVKGQPTLSKVERQAVESSASMKAYINDPTPLGKGVEIHEAIERPIYFNTPRGGTGKLPAGHIEAIDAEVNFYKTLVPELNKFKNSEIDSVVVKRLQEKYGKGIYGNELSKPIPFEAKNATEKEIYNLVKNKLEKVDSKSQLTDFYNRVKPLPTESKIDPVQKVIQALKEAKPIRGQQETLYSQERSKRLGRAIETGKKTSGEKGFYAQLGQLKGELPKAEFETIREKIGQQDIDSLFDMVKTNEKLTEWEKITARVGLGKLFGEFGGKVPTENELQLLTKVFGRDFVDAVLEKRSLFQKMKEAALQLANIPRSIMSSFDLSAPFRQGIFMIGRKQFWNSFWDMFKSFGSEKAFNAVQQSITQKKSFELMKESGLALTEMDSILVSREERFMSNWAEKIPLVGKMIRMSGRAYTAFLNKVRADVFDDLIRKAERLGLKPYENKDLTKSLARFINAATGRGSLGKLEKAAVSLNAFFFSPRLIASRLNLLNPLFYIKQDPFVRKEAMRSLFSFTGYVLTILTLAASAGASIETNPTSSDFGKVKIGNTRIDIMGGFQQYIRMFAQLIMGKYKSATTGKEFTLGEGYKPITRLDILGRQIESKEAPLFSFVTDLLKGKDYIGQPINIKNEIANRFVPMVIQDIIDIAKDDPSLIPLGSLAILGFGTQTFKPKPKSDGAFALPKITIPSLEIPSFKVPSLSL